MCKVKEQNNTSCIWWSTCEYSQKPNRKMTILKIRMQYIMHNWLIQEVYRCHTRPTFLEKRTLTINEVLEDRSIMVHEMQQLQFLWLVVVLMGVEKGGGCNE